MARFYSRQKCCPYFVLNIKFDMLIFDVYYTFTALQIINYNYRLNLIKVKAWEEVASQISECFPSRPPRTTQQCKKEYYSLVSRSRMEIGQKKRSICMTGKIVFINNSFIYVSYVIIYEKIISISIFSYIFDVYLLFSLAYLTWIDHFLSFFFTNKYILAGGGNDTFSGGKKTRVSGSMYTVIKGDTYPLFCIEGLLKFRHMNISKTLDARAADWAVDLYLSDAISWWVSAVPVRVPAIWPFNSLYHNAENHRCGLVCNFGQAYTAIWISFTSGV